MRIQGDLATYELSDLLQWLAQGRKTGLLTISDGDYEHQLGFDKGLIDMSASTDPARHLDRYLSERELIDEGTLARAARLREATQMLSGQVLVTLGAVSEEELAEVMRRKTEELVSELLTWTDGTFEFVGAERRDGTMVPLRLEVTKLLLESMQQLDERQPRVEAAPELVPGEPLAEAAVPDAALADGDTAPAAASQPAPATPEPPRPAAPADGLVLAEVLHPADAYSTAVVPLPEPAPVPPEAAEIPVQYAAMLREPSPWRRLIPFALIAVASVTAFGFYLANREASALAAPAGEPILFGEPAPLPPRAAVARSAAPAPPEVGAAPAPAAVEPDSELALRERYERQLEALRRELAAAREEATQAQDEPSPEAVVSAVAAGAASARPTPPTPPAAADRAAATAPALASPAPPESAVQRERAPEPSTGPAAEDPPGVRPDPAEPAPEPSRAEAQPAAGAVPPTLLKRPQPLYPRAARRLGRGARVTLRVLVGADGRVEEIEPVGRKAGLGFDRAAEEAARATVWQPGTLGGKPSPMWTELRFDFRP